MTAAADSAPARSPATVRTYARDWDLFTDWCTVTGRSALPAEPATVVAFLRDCPAALGTQRRRVTAIDHQHSNCGHPKPGESSAVRAVIGRHSAEPVDTADPNPAAVDAALRLLPSHGWTRGMFGRCDRCLLVLSQLARVPYQHLATRTAGDITLLEGTARIRSDAGTWELRPGDNALLCGPCAVTRWLRALEVEITAPSTRVLANRIRKAPPVTDRSPHLCRSTRPLSPETLDAPLLVSIDQWGYVPFPPLRLTPHSLSRRVRDLLAGDLGAHRQLPIDGDEDTEPETPAPAPVVRRGVYSREDSQR
ncbi:MAG: hypothetical protein ABJD68_17980, partial [Nakamurella sp.]